MSVLVTGGTGFIGTNLCKKLLDRGYSVKTFSQGTKRYDLAILEGVTVHKKTEQIIGDIRDFKAIKKASRGADYIFHLAAYIPKNNIGYLYNPSLISDINIIGTANVLESARQNDVNKVIFSSSQTVYGKPKVMPVKEIDPLSPNIFYGYSKMVAEKICYFFHENFDMDIKILRYASVYGPLQRTFEIVPKFSICAERNSEITIYGDGNQFRDFVYVGDVSKANILCAEKNSKFDIFNVGSGMALSINDLANIIILNSKSLSNIKYDKSKKDDYSIYLDITRIKKEIGYNPIDPMNGIKKYLKWRGYIGGI